MVMTQLLSPISFTDEDKIYISGIDKDDTIKYDLEQWLNQFGPVTQFKIISRDMHPKDIAFVTYKYTQHAILMLQYVLQYKYPIKSINICKALNHSRTPFAPPRHKIQLTDIIFYSSLAYDLTNYLSIYGRIVECTIVDKENKKKYDFCDCIVEFKHSEDKIGCIQDANQYFANKKLNINDFNNQEKKVNNIKSVDFNERDRDREEERNFSVYNYAYPPFQTPISPSFSVTSECLTSLLEKIIILRPNENEMYNPENPAIVPNIS